MISRTGPSVRTTFRSCASPLRFQRRWAQVHDVRFVTTQQQNARVLDRYKDKLVLKAHEEGHDSISSLKDAYRHKIAEYRRSSLQTPSKAQSKKTDSLFQQRHPPGSPTQTATSASTSISPKPTSPSPYIKPLSSYLDLEKVSALPKRELEYIWRLRHASDPLSLCAVIPIETYNRIQRTARSHPQFILPVPSPETDDTGEGKKGATPTPGSGSWTAADIHFLQWAFHPPIIGAAGPELTTLNTHTSTVIFTHLASYKLRGEYAPPHTTITHHLDLADSHGVVLLNGSVMRGSGVSVEEGRWLVMCLQKFYDFEGQGSGVGRDKRQNLLEKFSKGDQDFTLKELVDEAERAS